MPLGAFITMTSSVAVAIAIITIVVVVCQAWFVGYYVLLAGLFPARVNASAVGILGAVGASTALVRSEEHTSELQSLMRISYAVFCLKKKIESEMKPAYNITIASIHTTCLNV